MALVDDCPNIATEGEQAFTAFASLIGAWPQSTARFQCQLPATELESESQRFRLWADNLGLLETGHRSLYYRVQDVPAVGQYIVDLLEELNDYLTESQSHLTTKSLEKR
jgi:hypothetical protein